VTDIQSPASPTTRYAKLQGIIIVTGNILLKTGMRIGATSSALSIGGVENVVIRNPLTGQPYIPGSSLRGKMRSLSEKLNGRPQNTKIGTAYIHTCERLADYNVCPVCPVFGIPAEREASAPTRLKVRDIFLTEKSVEELSRLRTDLPYTEVKWEAAIDRVTAQAVPRQMERVPAGAEFEFELIFSVFDDKDFERFNQVLSALELVEDDYLGGQGSRGYGQVAFTKLNLLFKAQADYVSNRGRREAAGDLNLKEMRDWISKHDIRKEFSKESAPAQASDEMAEGQQA
jgi:CRISPR-associated protein Csm3